jgi:uncharacterized membrane protein
MAVDWLWGLSVLFMIQHHATDLLIPALRAGRAYGLIDRVDGLVAPAFLLSAGFSLALVQVRSGGSPARLRRTLFRLGEVLLAATFVNWLWFPLRQEPRWLLRLDILHCVGFSLLLALPLAAALAHRPAALRVAGTVTGLALFAVTPIAERFTGWAGNFVNVNEGSVFPLLPWAGYVFLGLALGAAGAEGRTPLLRWSVWVGLLGVAVFLLTPLWQRLYPPHGFWISDPGRHGDRWALCCAILIALSALERRASAGVLSSGPVRFVDFFGRASLSAYVAHEMLLYYPLFGFSFHGVWGERCGWLAYSLLTVALIGATYAACQAYAAAEKGVKWLWGASKRFAYRRQHRSVL